MTMAPGQYIDVTSPASITTLTNPITNVSGKVVVNGSLLLGDVHNNESTDLEHWEVQEFRKFIKWYINMHNPEAIEQFLAIRKIEKANERQEQLAREMAWHERELELRKQMAQEMIRINTKNRTIWGKVKDALRGKKVEHGDYY